MPEMRVVHAVQNVAGVPVALAKAQRALGHQAVAVLSSRLGGPAPGAVDLDRLVAGGPVTRKIRRAQLVSHLAASYDIFHFHYVGTFMRGYVDLAALKALGKTVVFHLHGCDIRDPLRVRREYAVSACAECNAPCLTSAKRALPDAIRRYADAVIVSTPDLLEFVPDAHYIPNPLDSSLWDASMLGGGARSASADEWIIVHAPTNRAIKGTRHIEAAVDALRSAGLPVRLRLLEGLSRQELRQECLDADIAVDQVLVGWVGVFALEMMALGKPVVAYIRPDLADITPDPPIVSACPATLADVLRDLLLSPERRADLAALGPDFVRKHHDPLIVGRRIVQLYEQRLEHRGVK